MMHSSEEPHSRETKTDRAARRRIRRWERRARAVAPLLAVPAMLGLLILSVDLIEYQPGETARHALPSSATDERRTNSGLQGLAVDPQSVSAISVVGSSALGSDALGASVVGSAMPIDAAMPTGSPLSTGMELDAASDAALFADPTPLTLPSSSAPLADDDAILEPITGTRAVR